MSLILEENLKEKTYKEFYESLTIQKVIKRALPLSISILSDGFAEIESKNLRVNEILLSAKSFAELRAQERSLIDPECKTKNLEKGIMGYLWGASIVVARTIPDNITFILSELEPKKTVILNTKENGYNPTKELLKQVATLEKLLKGATTELFNIKNTIYDITKTKE